MLVCMFFANKYKRMVWVDETGFRTHMTRRRGWSKVGTRVRFTCRRRSAPYTMVCAMGWDGVVCNWVFPKGLDKKRWRSFITQKLLESLEPNRLIFWDNLNIHQDRALIRLLNKSGHLVMFTPPYSPEGNPIEYMFSKLKSFVRRQGPRGAKALRDAITSGLQTITPNDIASYFFVAWGHVLSWR